MLFPPKLSSGQRVAIVAPASPFPWTDLCAGLAWLGARYELVTTSRIFARTGYLAGADEDRAAELAHAFARDDVGAIFCARGGYGLVRILDRLPWDALMAHPKWIVGFSDVTALHLEASAHGLASVHASNVTGLARQSAALPVTRRSLLRALEGRPREPFHGLRVLRRGVARGPLIGGNLTLAATLAAAGKLTLPDGAIVLLEDVTERPYRIDRMLTSLRIGGHFARAAAIVFGDFDACGPGPDGVTVEDVLADFSAHVGVPVACGAPFGHADRNEAFIHGELASLDGDVLRFGQRS